MSHRDVQMPRRPWMVESGLSHGETPVPSALSVFTSEFEKGSGGSHSLLPPGKLVWK